jgi:dolichol-phosphate mannosyltransferase
MIGSRPVVFTLVGIVGYVVQMAALWLLAGRARLPIVPATLVATELAVLHNFAWHARWTWSDRPAGPLETVTRLVRFNLANGAVSLAGAALLMPVLVYALGVHYLLANLLTVLACAVINYVAGDRFVFVPSAR